MVLNNPYAHKRLQTPDPPSDLPTTSRELIVRHLNIKDAIENQQPVIAMNDPTDNATDTHFMACTTNESSENNEIIRSSDGSLVVHLDENGDDNDNNIINGDNINGDPAYPPYSPQECSDDDQSRMETSDHGDAKDTKIAESKPNLVNPMEKGDGNETQRESDTGDCDNAREGCSNLHQLSIPVTSNSSSSNNSNTVVRPTSSQQFLLSQKLSWGPATIITISELVQSFETSAKSTVDTQCKESINCRSVRITGTLIHQIRVSDRCMCFLLRDPLAMDTTSGIHVPSSGRNKTPASPPAAQRPVQRYETEQYKNKCRSATPPTLSSSSSSSIARKPPSAFLLKQPTIGMRKTLSTWRTPGKTNSLHSTSCQVTGTTTTKGSGIHNRMTPNHTPSHDTHSRHQTPGPLAKRKLGMGAQSTLSRKRSLENVSRPPSSTRTGLDLKLGVMKPPLPFLLTNSDEIKFAFRHYFLTSDRVVPVMEGNVVWVVANPVLVNWNDCREGDLVMCIGQVRHWTRESISCDAGSIEHGCDRNSSFEDDLQKLVKGLLQPTSCERDHDYISQPLPGTSKRGNDAEYNALLSPLLIHFGAVEARILRNVNGTDMCLYQEALLIRREYLRQQHLHD